MGVVLSKMTPPPFAGHKGFPNGVMGIILCQILCFGLHTHQMSTLWEILECPVRQRSPPPPSFFTEKREADFVHPLYTTVLVFSMKKITECIQKGVSLKKQINIKCFCEGVGPLTAMRTASGRLGKSLDLYRSNKHFFFMNKKGF